MAHNRAQLNALIFHNPVILPRTSPGFGEVSLAVAELQGGNYVKAAMFAEIGVGKDPTLAAGWLAKTAADVFEATPADLRTERAVFCLDRALECAPSCRSEMTGFFLNTVVGHYVHVLCAGAVAEAEQWKAHEASAMGMQYQAGINAGLGLAAALTALCSRNFGVRVLGGVASAVAFSQSDDLASGAQLASDLGDGHRAASLMHLLAARGLVTLGLQLAQVERLPPQPLDPVIREFTESFREVWSHHLVSLMGALHKPILDAIRGNRKELARSYWERNDMVPLTSGKKAWKYANPKGPHPASRATLGWLEQMLPGAGRLPAFEFLLRPLPYVKRNNSWWSPGRLEKSLWQVWMVDTWITNPPGGILGGQGTASALPAATSVAQPVQGAGGAEPAGCLVWVKRIALTILGLFIGLVVLGVIVGHPPEPGQGTASPAPSASVDPEKQTTPKVRRATAVEPVASPATTTPAVPFSATPVGKYYAVMGIADGDALNVHTGPGANTSISARLANGASKIEITGPSAMNGRTEWVPVRFKNQTGWVAKQYLKQW